MTFSLLANLALLAAATASTPVPQPEPTAAATPAAAEKPPEKLLCRKERVTGSLTRVRKICMTQRDWDTLASNTRKSMDDLRGDAGVDQRRGALPGM